MNNNNNIYKELDKKLEGFYNLIYKLDNKLVEFGNKYNVYEVPATVLEQK